MQVTETSAPPGVLVLHIPDEIRFDNERLFLLCEANEDVHIEREANGDIIVMSPTGSRGSSREADVIRQLGMWAEIDGTGVVFSSAGGFVLPNGAMRAPDAAWIRSQKVEPFSEDEQDKFLPVAPDFVVEIRSRSESLPWLQRKLEEYIENGVEMGWLIDPADRTVYVYKQGKARMTFRDIEQISGDPVLPGFVLKLERIWKRKL